MAVSQKSTIEAAALGAALPAATIGAGPSSFGPGGTLTYAEAKAIIEALPSTQFDLPAYTGGTTDNAYLKSYVTSLISTYYGVSADTFDHATLASTTLIRDFLNRALMFQDDWVSRGSLDANGLTIAPAFNDVASLLRYPATDSCGGHNFQLFEIFRAFGYDCAWIDSINGVDGYTSSHATVTVHLEDIGKWIVQDSYENYLFTSPGGAFLSYGEARAAAAAGTGPSFDGEKSFLDFQQTGEGRVITPENQAIVTGDVFSLPYNMVYSIGGVQYTYSTASLFPNYAGAYDPGVSEGGVFASRADAVAAIEALHDSGLTWQAAANALRVDHYLSAFMLRPGSADASAWLTLRLADGSYVSVNYNDSDVLDGSFEQLVFAAGNGPDSRLGDRSPDDFFGGVYVIGYDGYAYSDWDGRTVLNQNHAPQLEAVRYYAEAGQPAPLAALFQMLDQDGDSVSALYAEVSGTPGGATLVSADWGDVASGARFIPLPQLQGWGVDPGDGSAPSTITLRATDGISWTAGISLEVGITGTVANLSAQSEWSAMRWYDYGGQREREEYQLNNGNSRVVEYDTAGAFAWRSIATERDSGAHVLTIRTAYDTGGGQDRIDTAINYVLKAGDTAALLGPIDPAGVAPLALTGNALGNSLAGNAGANLLNGGGGADKMAGHLGNDWYVVDNARDQVTELANEGVDTVQANVDYVLQAGTSVEWLSTWGTASTAPLHLTGNELANIITGNAGANLLDGGGGADQMIGHLGDDWYVVDNAGDQVTEVAGEGYDSVQANVDYVLQRGTSVERLSTWGTASTTPLHLTGNELANMIVGNAGANLLDGGAGADQMTGGLGNDWYIVDNAGDKVTEAANAGVDAIQTNVDYVLQAGSSIEWLLTWGEVSTTPLHLTGNELANSLEGNSGANFLDGGKGADLMIGHKGDDWYMVDNAGDVVTEAAGEGTDAIQTNVDYVLQAGTSVEWLGTWGTVSTTPLHLTGNELANRIVGNNGANVLDGKGGADEMFGYGGSDTFAFTSALGTGNVDRIGDFQPGADKIALDDAVFGTLPTGALASGAFGAGATAQDADDRILYDSASGALYYDADGIGGVAAVQFATLSSGLTLHASDFTVI